MLRHASALGSYAVPFAALGSPRQAQQVAQSHERPIGGLDVPVHQRGDGVQRFEQEVWVELLLERLELGLDEPRLEL